MKANWLVRMVSRRVRELERLLDSDRAYIADQTEEIKSLVARVVRTESRLATANMRLMEMTQENARILNTAFPPKTKASQNEHCRVGRKDTCG